MWEVSISSGKVGADVRAAASLALMLRPSSWRPGHLCPPESMPRVLGKRRTNVVGGCLSTPRLRARPVVITEFPVNTLRIPEVTNDPCGRKPWRPHEGPVLTCQAISFPEPQSISFLSKVLAGKPPSHPRYQLHLTGLLCAWPFL